MHSVQARPKVALNSLAQSPTWQHNNNVRYGSKTEATMGSQGSNCMEFGSNNWDITRTALGEKLYVHDEKKLHIEKTRKCYRFLKCIIYPNEFIFQLEDDWNSLNVIIFFKCLLGDTSNLDPEHLMKMSRSMIGSGEFINLFYEVPETFVTNERWTISDYDSERCSVWSLKGFNVSTRSQSVTGFFLYFLATIKWLSRNC